MSYDPDYYRNRHRYLGHSEQTEREVRHDERIYGRDALPEQEREWLDRRDRRSGRDQED